jgi:hypothetical protein
MLELSKNHMPTEEFPKSILLPVSDRIARSEERKSSTGISYSAQFFSAHRIMTFAFAASDSQAHTETSYNQ